MILKHLTLNNFRQFKGEQVVEFAQPGNKNVTVIHAENGFGKTTLLSALRWGFWGSTTHDLMIPEKIITECVVTSDADPNNTKASIEICYLHEEEEFILKRSITLAQQQHDHKKTEIFLFKVVNGVLEEQNNQTALINVHVPEAMGDFFFFNGERIDHLALDENAHQLRKAIYRVLGLELLESAIANAKQVMAKLNKELRKYADHSGQSLIDQSNALFEENVKLKAEILNHQANQKASQDEVQTINRNLEANAESRNAQQRRNDLENNLKTSKGALLDKDSQIKKLLTDKAYYLLSDNLTAAGQETVVRLEDEGVLPPKLTTTVLDQLLQDERCICTQDLSDGSPYRKAIKDLISRVSDRSLDDATHTIKTALSNLTTEGANIREEFKTNKQRKDAIKTEIGGLEAEIREISKKIKAGDDEKAQDLESRRVSLNEKISALVVRISMIQKEIEKKEQQKATVDKEAQAAQLADIKGKKIQQQIIATEKAIGLMEAILEAEKEELRIKLNTTIQKDFSQITLKPNFVAELSADFKLRVTKPTPDGKEDVARSTGERQITSLTFIASLIGLARARKEIPTVLKGLWGGLFPMVMDSPFGTLGDNYRGQVMEWLPGVAPQVAIFVSDSQWRGPVEESVAGKIGQEYLLEYHAPETQELASEKAVIRGQTYDQFYVSEEEFTKIIKL